MQRGIYIIVLLLIPFVSCKRDIQETNKALIISIKNFKNQPLMLSDILTDIKIMPLKTDENNLLGNLKDICCSDRYLYVLDDLTASVFMFDIENGTFLKRISNKGNGPNEYIHPTAIRFDSLFVYLLDFPTRKIIVFNEDLKAIKTIQIHVSSYDFSCTDDGFLLYSMDDSAQSYKLIYIDMNGAVIDQFIPYTESNSSKTHNWGRPANFSTYNQDICFSEPFSNKIYLWKNKRLILNYQFDFGKLTIPGDINTNDYTVFEDFPYVVCTHFFTLQDQLALSFLYEDKRYYNITNLLTQEQKTGVIDSQYVPFFPQWQAGNTLIGSVRYEDIKADFANLKPFLVKRDDNCLADDDETPYLIFFTLY